MLVMMTARAQEKVQFTQYMFNGLAINPAVAGTDEALHLTFLNRSQWVGLDGAPVTQTLSAHTGFANRHVGVGLTLVNDKIGVNKNQIVQASFAYHLRVSKKATFSMGLMPGVSIRKSDYASVAAGSNDPMLSNLSHTSPTLGAGFYFQSRRWQAGLSAPELMPEKYAVNDTTTISWKRAQYFFFLQYTIPLTNTVDFQPSVLVKYLQGLPTSFDVNACLVLKKALTLGVSYRKKESIDFLFRAQVTQQLQLGYAYDHGIGTLSRNTNGSHELMVSYLFRRAETKIESPR